tara:strand:- start:2010 stop:3287 length:1278 start_codon:yes stop_codon:yes gene_type:complete
MLSKTDSTRKGPSILLLSASAIALLYGGVLVWLGLVDDRFAGRPVVELSLPPEPVPDKKLADAQLRDSTDGDVHAAPDALHTDAPSDAGAHDETPGATPLPAGTESLSPEELTLLEAAKNIRDGSEDADKDGPMGDVKIVGAETIVPRSDGKAMSTTGEVPPLKPVPDPALIAAGSQGPLPIVAADGRKAWQVYARPLPAGLGTGPRIALVVSGLGISDSATAHAIKTLPPEVTLSFAPYGGNLQRWIKQAREAGHEVLVELPMEPFGYPQNDPGPYTLLTSLSASDNVGRLEWLLSRFTGYVGVMNYQGARFTSEPNALAPVLSAIKSRGLMYVDNGASNRSLAPKLAGEAALPNTLATRNIDPVQSADIIANSFKSLETTAKDNGRAVGVASGFPVTVDALSDWAATLRDKGITLVPVSAMAQ